MPWTAKSHRLRTGRYSEANRIYLITLVCDQRKAVFNNLQSGRCCVHALQQVSNQAETLCFVIMPDHLHWLMQLKNEANLSATVQKLRSLVTKKLHVENLYGGKVWSRGFHDHAVRKEEDLKSIARYVIANPLRAGLVQSIGEYSLWDATWL